MTDTSLHAPVVPQISPDLSEIGQLGTLLRSIEEWADDFHRVLLTIFFLQQTGYPWVTPQQVRSALRDAGQPISHSLAPAYQEARRLDLLDRIEGLYAMTPTEIEWARSWIGEARGSENLSARL